MKRAWPLKDKYLRVSSICILLLMLAFSNAYARDHIEAYRNGILGLVYYEQGKYDSAEKYLVKALNLTQDKSRFGPYLLLIKIADTHKDEKKITAYLHELSCIHPKDTIYAYLKEYGDVNMDIATFNRLYKPKCVLTEDKKYADPHPKAVDSIIASLRDRDQDVRAWVNKKRGHMTEDEMVAFEKEMKFIDSTNFLMLYDCLKKYGFPEIDPPISWSRGTLIIHIDNYTNFKKVDKYLAGAVKDGKFSPQDYAYSMDRSLVASGMKPKYYWFITGTLYEEKYKPTKDELAKVNHDRWLIGLPPYPLWTGWGF